MSAVQLLSGVEFYRHSVTEEDIQEVAAVLRSVFLTTGPKAGAFEKAFAEYLGVQDVVTVSSCTSALFLSLVGLDIKDASRGVLQYESEILNQDGKTVVRWTSRMLVARRPGA